MGDSDGHWLANCNRLLNIDGNTTDVRFKHCEVVQFTLMIAVLPSAFVYNSIQFVLFDFEVIGGNQQMPLVNACHRLVITY